MKNWRSIVGSYLDQRRSQSKKASSLRRLMTTGISTVALWGSFGMVVPARAQTVTPPPVPAAIQVPPGNTAFLVGHAIGTQDYTCLPTGWKFFGPQATLFINVFGRFPQQIITHFLSLDTNPNPSAPNPLPAGSPTWQGSFDTSVVWGNKIGSINSGSDPSCPNSGAIPCLLLQAIGSLAGPTGGSFLTNVTYVQRLNTSGGSAPTGTCNVGDQALVHYTADYYFYRAQM